MKITVGRTALPDTPLLVVARFEGQEPSWEPGDGGAAGIGDAVAAALETGDFDGRPGSTQLVYAPAGAAGPRRVLLVGVGKPEKVTAETLRRLGGTVAKQAARLRVADVVLQMPAVELAPGEAARAVTEGAVLGAYTFTTLKSRAEDTPEPVALGELTILVGDGEDAAREGARVGEIAARHECLARDLGNLPGNVATPTYLASEAERVGRERGLQVTVLGPDALREEGMHALLGVSAGSAEEPRLIVMEHRGGAEGEKPLVLVGKGLTFDAGGISIKPAAGMEEMKFDMSGGGAVIAAMGAIAELGVAANVVGIVPASENLLGGAAMKPGDVLHTHLGKTVEVVNTDAEGRLILADALSYARRFDPAAVVDAATLTGACVIALGHQASAVMGTDDALVEELRAAGDRAGQRAWPLPLFDEYREQIRSDYADVKNSGGRPAGSVTAAWFLREFVGDFPWAHLDVAGTAWGDGKLSYQTKGSTGVPTRLFVEWVTARVARNPAA